MMGAVSISETLTNLYHTTRRNIPEDILVLAAFRTCNLTFPQRVAEAATELGNITVLKTKRHIKRYCEINRCWFEFRRFIVCRNFIHSIKIIRRKIPRNLQENCNGSRFRLYFKANYTRDNDYRGAKLQAVYSEFPEKSHFSNKRQLYCTPFCLHYCSSSSWT
jgi:hypothetical protein